jgi:Cellulase (glycosyl hydrolase family 5)
MRFAALTLLSCAFGVAAIAAEQPKPLMKDFIGLNGHTVQFKPDLYHPVCTVVRDYHPVEWDLGKETDVPTTFPMARNRVDWSQVYGSWRKAGYFVDVSLMFETIKQSDWKDVPRDAKACGLAFAKAFGPSSTKLVDSAEVGNEPGKWNDADYRIMFEAMASGLRAGDPKLTIVTCAADAEKSGDYMKAMSCVQGLEHLYDVINVHSYAQTENWPTWRRSFPEDPKLLDYTTRIDKLIAWRDAHAKGKPIWVTEFGYDASTKPAPKTGDFKSWVDVTDEQQGQWLVRSFLVFARMSVDKAYIYFFNDSDEPSFHASSGITRNWQPKPAYHAVAHLNKSLGEYRFAKTVTNKAGELQVDEYVHGSDAKQRVWVAWLASGADKTQEVTLPKVPGKVTKAERMPLAAGVDTAKATFTAKGSDVTLTVGESPTYLWIQAP